MEYMLSVYSKAGISTSVSVKILPCSAAHLYQCCHISDILLCMGLYRSYKLLGIPQEFLNFLIHIHFRNGEKGQTQTSRTNEAFS